MKNWIKINRSHQTYEKKYYAKAFTALSFIQSIFKSEPVVLLSRFVYKSNAIKIDTRLNQIILYSSHS